MTLPPPPTCPVCAAPVAQEDDACGACGLLFASYRPTATSAPFHVCRQPFDPGWQLAQGRYVISKRLSSGGMGRLFLAIDRSTFDRLVVVKVLRDTFSPADPQGAQAAHDRFVAEARTLAALRHPAVPQIYGYFQDGLHGCIVMEYIEGHDLDRGLSHLDGAGHIVAGGPYSRDAVIRWGVALCHALEYLHSRQPPVVHHDIKPANLVLDRASGEVRLIDFGTATAATGAPTLDSYGTPGYAPPEQYRGASEPRSDLYALAATLYHLASDDDPNAHPFSFPRLASLGTLGDALRPALADDVAARPHANELRERLEGILATNATRRLQLPDGSEATTVTSLVDWCAAHWSEAAKWLYGNLPDQIEHWWSRSDLAAALRATVQQYDDRNAGLDAALALLDPDGFGVEEPLLSTAQGQVDFGPISPRSSHEREVRIYNSGRRYIHAQISLPPWVTAQRSDLSLTPGHEQAIAISARPAQAKARGRLQGTLALLAGPGSLHIPVRAVASRPHVILGKMRGVFAGHPLILFAVILVLLFVVKYVTGILGY